MASIMWLNHTFEYTCCKPLTIWAKPPSGCERITDSYMQMAQSITAKKKTLKHWVKYNIDV